MLNPRKIKKKLVTVDREIGEAVVTITIYGRRTDELRTRVLTKDVIPIAIEGGAEVIGTIKQASITNRHGEATGVWIFKIPTKEPEYSTTTVLKRRKKKKTAAKTNWYAEQEE